MKSIGLSGLAMLTWGLMGVDPGATFLAADEVTAGPRHERKFHVVGYLPDYRTADIAADVGKFLTYLILFSAEPDPAGGLDLKRIQPEMVRKVRSIKERHGVAIHLCIGGWGRSNGIAKLAASPAARERFVAACRQFCLENKFDGVDLDWEHPADAAQQRDYGLLLTALKQGLSPQGMELTIAVAGWQDFSADAIGAVDRIHLMAYDAEGRHATFEFARFDVERLLKRGVPGGKICLGIPFYGRGVQDRSREQTYAQLAEKFQPPADVDEVDGVYFNGINLVERKTGFAVSEKLAGVMAWEIGQDASGDASLLKAMWTAAKTSGK